VFQLDAEAASRLLQLEKASGLNLISLLATSVSNFVRLRMRFRFGCSGATPMKLSEEKSERPKGERGTALKNHRRFSPRKKQVLNVLALLQLAHLSLKLVSARSEPLQELMVAV
jgi:hypothetical protein